MNRRIFLLLLVIATSTCLFAQTSNNPFSKYGYKKHVVYTSSKGEFEEFHGNDDIVEIGSVYFNTKTKEIVGYVNEENSAEVANATSAMSVDPLCEKYYWISPYAYCLNNPIKYRDPDGRWVESAWDAANVVLGAKSFVSNVSNGNIGGAILDGVGVLVDVAATIVPVVPGGASTVIKAVRAGDRVMDAAATARGVKNEAKVLKEMDIPKNNTTFQAMDPVTGKQYGVKPDGISANKVVEVKDTKSVSNTKQIRGERQIAKQQGKEFQIVTGENTHVSKNIPKDEVLKVPYLGPQ
jgi:hypothetical protein